ncbi:hypothetical protein, partial [Streptomyces sp. NPDC058297]|uniref:hypothetical protein n=1 Tax=Streptomyces sp. NPDC058297 TaxID=3346433 RepID=UPI0036E32923
MTQSQQALVAALGVVVFVACLARAVTALRRRTEPGRGPVKRRGGPGLLDELPQVWQANYRFLFSASV